MMKTILMGSRVLVQGIFVKSLADGMISVRVGEKVFSGKPVSVERAA